MSNLNFKKWAFHFTLWIAVINIITFYLVVNYTGFPGSENNIGLGLFYFGILSSILLLLTTVFIVISTIQKEAKNYQYWISVIGIVLFGILPLLSGTLI